MTGRWANIQDAGALEALLERIAGRFPPASIDTLWILPTRRSADAESSVVVLSMFDDEGMRRRVATVHFLVTRDRRGAATVNEKPEEHASAPAEAIDRIIEGVLRRLEHEADTLPRRVGIAGDEAAWRALVDEVADPASRPRAAPAAEPEAEPAGAAALPPDTAVEG